jgi:hypothetical protein
VTPVVILTQFSAYYNAYKLVDKYKNIYYLKYIMACRKRKGKLKWNKRKKATKGKKPCRG